MNNTRGEENPRCTTLFQPAAAGPPASNKAFTCNVAIRPDLLIFQTGSSETSHTYRQHHRFAPPTGSLTHSSCIFFSSQLLGETIFNYYLREIISNCEKQVNFCFKFFSKTLLAYFFSSGFSFPFPITRVTIIFFRRCRSTFVTSTFKSR